MSSHEIVSPAAVLQVNGMLLEGKKVYVGPFLKRSDRPADKDVRFTNVFVKNLAESVDDEKLREMFAAYGEVTSAIVMKVSTLFKGLLMTLLS